MLSINLQKDLLSILCIILFAPFYFIYLIIICCSNHCDSCSCSYESKRKKNNEIENETNYRDKIKKNFELDSERNILKNSNKFSINTSSDYDTKLYKNNNKKKEPEENDDYLLNQKRVIIQNYSKKSEIEKINEELYLINKEEVNITLMLCHSLKK